MFEKRQKILTSEEVKGIYPLTKELKEIKCRTQNLITDVLTGKSDKMIILVGPCSAHSIDPVLEYVTRLGKLNDKVKDKLVLVPRIYTNKPRTKGIGYKGMFSQPMFGMDDDINKGVKFSRWMHIKAIEASGLGAADEMLYPTNYEYTDDLLAYTTVGARSSGNQLHRLAISGLETPVGIKNPISGNVTVMLNSVFAGQNRQIFKFNDWEVETSGNELCHVILRGMVDAYGNEIPNFHYENIMQVLNGYNEFNLKNPAIIIDTNHTNSGKKFKQQARICNEVMQNRLYDKEFKGIVKGFMIESFLVEGCQKEDNVYGKSVTDPCLGWDDTERLILDIAGKV